MHNKALHRTAHKVRRPVKADVQRKHMIFMSHTMKWHACMSLILLSVVAMTRHGVAQWASNEVYFTSIVFTNDSALRMELVAPPQQVFVMEWSSDLQTWHPLYSPPPFGLRTVYSASDEGIAIVSNNPSIEENQKYFRATPLLLPEE